MKKGCVLVAVAALAVGCINSEKSGTTGRDATRLIGSEPDPDYSRYLPDYEGLKRKKELEKQGLYIGPHESYLVCSPQKKQQGDFAMELYRQMAYNKDNFAFSRMAWLASVRSWELARRERQPRRSRI